MQQNEQAAVTDKDLEEEAFQAEMNAEIDASAPIVEQKEAETDTSESEESEQEAQQETKPERTEIIDGMTAEEVKAALAEIPRLRKGLDTLGGTYGERVASLQKTIDELKNQRQQVADQTQQQIQSKMSPERFTRLKKEFPELGELIEEALGDVITQQPPQIDLSSFDQKLQSKLDEERQVREQEQLKREIRLLKREHPDFEEVAGYQPTENGLVQWNNPAFGNWVAAQSKEIQNQVLNGSDAFDLADIITNFKESLKAEQEITLKQKKQTNLEKAVQPKGMPASRLSSPLDEEERLFREEMEKEY